MQKLKILMVDDHPVIIEAYKNILDSSGFEEVYNFSIDTAINCDTAIEKIDSSACCWQFWISILFFQKWILIGFDQ